jgi:hypothetical protein
LPLVPRDLDVRITIRVRLHLEFSPFTPSTPQFAISEGRSEMHFSLVVVDGGNEMLAVETDADTVVSGTLQR